jgi:hypothetical protein
MKTGEQLEALWAYQMCKVLGLALEMLNCIESIVYNTIWRRLTIVEYLVMKSELISGCIVLSCLALSM